jgi:hypothetical protein
MNDLGFTEKQLPRHDHIDLQYRKSAHQSYIQKRKIQGANTEKKYVIERNDPSLLYQDMIDRSDYLMQKATDVIDVLTAVTKTLHYDFTTCQDEKFLQPLVHDENKKRSLREVFTALTLVQNDVPREEIDEFIDKLYQLNENLDQLLVSVENFDNIIITVAWLIDDAKDKLEQALVDATLSQTKPLKPETTRTENTENAEMNPNSELERRYYSKTSKDFTVFRTRRLKELSGKPGESVERKSIYNMGQVKKAASIQLANLTHYVEHAVRMDSKNEGSKRNWKYAGTGQHDALKRVKRNSGKSAGTHSRHTRQSTGVFHVKKP